MVKPLQKTTFLAFLLFVFFISIYLLTSSDSHIYRGDTVWARYEMTKSMVERHDLSIPNGLGIQGVDGRDYHWGDIGQSILAVPFYFVGKHIKAPENSVSAMNQLFGAATAAIFFLFLVSLGYSHRASLYTTFLYGLGTIAWPCAKSPFEHTIETYFVLLSVYLMYLSSIRKKLLYLMLSAFSLGIAFLTRTTSLLVVPPLLIMMFVNQATEPYSKASVKLTGRNAVFFFMVLLPFIGISLWYNYYRFGSLFETGFQVMAARLGLNFFTGTPLLTGLSGFLIGPGKGFFYYSPIAVLCFFSIKPFLKKYPALGACLICSIISYFIFMSKNAYWHGDWAWGPRYLLVITPFFLIPTAHILDSGKWLTGAFFRKALYFILALSFMIQMAAVSVDFRKYFVNLETDEKVTFTLLDVKGVPSIHEPPLETYFDWRKSPIIAQFRFIYNMAETVMNGEYSKPFGNITADKMKLDPHMVCFDFWWVYRYVLTGSRSGFLEALVLLCSAICAVATLLKTVHDP